MKKTFNNYIAISSKYALHCIMGMIKYVSKSCNHIIKSFKFSFYLLIYVIFLTQISQNLVSDFIVTEENIP